MLSTWHKVNFNYYLSGANSILHSVENMQPILYHPALFSKEKLVIYVS